MVLKDTHTHTPQDQGSSNLKGEFFIQNVLFG